MLLTLFLLLPGMLFNFSISFIQGTTTKTVLSIVYFKLHFSSNSLLLASFSSSSTLFIGVSKHLKAVNCCWKAFHLRFFWQSSATHEETALKYFSNQIIQQRLDKLERKLKFVNQGKTNWQFSKSVI